MKMAPWQTAMGAPASSGGQFSGSSSAVRFRRVVSQRACVCQREGTVHAAYPRISGRTPLVRLCGKPPFAALCLHGMQGRARTERDAEQSLRVVFYIHPVWLSVVQQAQVPLDP